MSTAWIKVSKWASRVIWKVKVGAGAGIGAGTVTVTGAGGAAPPGSQQTVADVWPAEGAKESIRPAQTPPGSLPYTNTQPNATLTHTH